MQMWAALRKQLRHQEITLLMFLAAIALLKFPLQHYITLARFQHYGLCLYIWSLGFILQTIWSWRQLTARGRTCLISTGLYIGLFAVIFYESPWLDSRMAVQTDEQNILRLLYAALCALCGLIDAIIWLFWLLEKKNIAAENRS